MLNIWPDKFIEFTCLKSSSKFRSILWVFALRRSKSLSEGSEQLRKSQLEKSWVPTCVSWIDANRDCEAFRQGIWSPRRQQLWKLRLNFKSCKWWKMDKVTWWGCASDGAKATKNCVAKLYIRHKGGSVGSGWGCHSLDLFPPFKDCWRQGLICKSISLNSCTLTPP